ncbi:hypothetical protein OHD25_01910, partial [Escherichia coli]|nr:hypothetical protein [Escherichia coli]
KSGVLTGKYWRDEIADGFTKTESGSGFVVYQGDVCYEAQKEIFICMKNMVMPGLVSYISSTSFANEMAEMRQQVMEGQIGGFLLGGRELEFLICQIQAVFSRK